MYTQFFGNYLLSRGAVTTQQLVDAIKEQSSAHIKLGTLAIHSGYMTASEVENIIIMQTHQDKRFGELAISEGYLTDAQVHELIECQNPDFLLLGQILIEKGIMTHAEFETYLIDYQSENEVTDFDISTETQEQVATLIKNFLKVDQYTENEYIIHYLTLLFNNLVRFIGDDFTPLNPMVSSDIPINYCIAQEISGPIKILSALNMDENTAVQFASQYVGDTFDSFDEYVKASVEDFLNLHNGLFNVNMSNEHSIELTLAPPKLINDPSIKSEGITYLLPIAYSFGILYFVVSY